MICKFFKEWPSSGTIIEIDLGIENVLEFSAHPHANTGKNCSLKPVLENGFTYFCCVYVHMCVCTHVCICTCICMFMWVWVCVCIWIYVCMGMCVSLYTYTCVHICVCLYMCVLISLCVYMYLCVSMKYMSSCHDMFGVCMHLYVCVLMCMCMHMCVLYVSRWVCMYVHTHVWSSGGPVAICIWRSEVNFLGLFSPFIMNSSEWTQVVRLEGPQALLHVSGMQWVTVWCQGTHLSVETQLWLWGKWRLWTMLT